MVWSPSGFRRWVLALPLVVVPLACGEDRRPLVPGTSTAASAGNAGSAGRASAGEGGEAGEETGAGQAGDGGAGQAGAVQGSGGSGGRAGSGSGATGGSAANGGRGGSAGTMSDGGTLSVGGSNAEGGAAAEAGGAGEGGAAATGGVAGVGGGAGTAGDAGTGGMAGTAGTGGAPPECVEASDCDTARGPSPCGLWICTGAGKCQAESSGCTDADGDGYGAGASCQCEELDCDDGTALLGGRLEVGEACYTGSQSTRGVGICREGVRYCRGGPCAGEVTPAPEACNGQDDDCDGPADEGFGVFTCGVGACATSTEACVEGTIDQCTFRRQTSTDGCNGIDDDCDGGIDEDCPGTCVRVSLSGDDAAAALSNGVTPFRNVQPAIDFAYSTPSAPKHVCIASGATCANGTTATYPGPAGAPLTMRNGVHVTGRYETTAWTRCRNGADVKTILQPTTSVGLLFPSSIVDRTIAFGLHVDRAVFPTSAAITVDGAKNVLLASVVAGGPTATTYSYGVNVINGADVHLFESGAGGGAASVESIGLRVVGARALLEDSGAGAGTGNALGTVIGVLFDSAPGSRISGSSAYAGGGGIQSEAFGVVVTGDGSGVVVDHSTVTGFHPRTYEFYGAVGIATYDCDDSTPWITTSNVTSNGRFADEGYSYGIHADACSPSIDQNTSIRSFREGAVSHGGDAYTAYGIRCENPGTSMGCTVAGNLSISGDTWGSGTVINVAGRCARITRNTIMGRLRGSSGERPSGSIDCQLSACGRRVVGISGGSFIDANNIVAGCSLRSSGILGGNRISNNTVRGHTIEDCMRSGPSPSAPLVPASQGELGVSGGQYYEDNSVVVAAEGLEYIEPSPGAFHAAGIGGYVYLRNSFGVWFDTDAVVVEGRTPRRFERNHLSGEKLYYDIETATTLTTAAQVNALTDMISIGNTN
jgi:hypothetical protein